MVKLRLQTLQKHSPLVLVLIFSRVMFMLQSIIIQMDFNIQIGDDTPKNNFASSYSKEQINASPPPPEPAQSQPSFFARVCPLLSPSYYREYFDVRQTQVQQRVLKSLTPWKKDFFEGLGQKPDLYGPFWILTTIIFLLSLTGNLSRYLNNLGQQDFTFRMQLFRYSVIIMYSFGFGFPILLGMLLRFFNSKVGVFELICLYGYSLTCFILILLLCIIPVGIVHWILMGYGIVNSCLFLILNLKQQTNNLENAQKYIVYGLIVGVQITLFLLFKLVFFNMIFDIEAGNDK